MANYIVRDINLAPQGRQKIDWVRQHMPVLNIIRDDFKTRKAFKGLRVAMSIHLEAKTAYLAEVFKAAGAEVAITGSNPLSTQDDVAAALAAEGIEVYAFYNASSQEYQEHLISVLKTKPQLVIDDGGDLVYLLHVGEPDLAAHVLGGCEETTTGVARLHALEREKRLFFPMIAVNDAFCKYLFDNRYGTGESVWTGIMRTTNLIVAGKTAVVMGYGWCGKGVARRASGLGAKVIVCEVDPVKALEAHMDGFQVMPAGKAATKGDIFITVTGCKDVLREQHFRVMKDGAILTNAGHFDVEVSKTDLEKLAVSKRTVRQNIKEYILPEGRRLYLLGEGRLVNLACSDGHPAEIMDLSFALQALSAHYLAENASSLTRRVHPVPKEIDYRVAELKLKSLEIETDALTSEQQAYLNSWTSSP
ncbi:MAG TPA: adenosylhomocysteinase [Desulfotomaculum sp.]|jgi:adenosylhomocysteinase|nr:adenosylhomocysteinase [Desulfotomaculum sp.]HCJ78535.1 adenosylhomocysteinase [Desulfotomaculum sp.]